LPNPRAAIHPPAIEERFGTLPEWADMRLRALTPAELENLRVRVLEANTIGELFG